MASIRLGDLLVKAKVITDSQLKSALGEQGKWGGRLGEILVRMDIVTEDMLVKALSKQLNLPAVNVEGLGGIAPYVRAKVPIEIARDIVALPMALRDEGKTLVVAMAEPQNVKHLDTLRSVSRCRIIAQVAGRQSIARAIGRFYEGEAEVTPEDPSFKIVNAQGRTLIKSVEEIEKERPPPPVAKPTRKTSSNRALTPKAPAPDVSAPTSLAGKTPSETLTAIEAAQRKEVAALKAMVELLIDKGVFTRDEYLTKVKR